MFILLQTQPVALIQELLHVSVQREDDVSSSVIICLQEGRELHYYLEDRDANEFSLCLSGYYRLMMGKKNKKII